MVRTNLENYITENLDRIYRFSFNRLRNEYNAEDLTQDIIFTAMRNVENMKDITKLDAWFWGVARNVYLRSFKQKREIPIEESMIIDLSGTNYTTPESEYMKNIDISNIRRAISSLAKIYRDVAVLYYLEEKNYNTIADELSIPLSSVKWRLNQSKKQLKEEIEKMDTKYMANGYRTAVDYNLKFGGASKGYNDYGGAEKALNGLLAKNICLTAYDTPKTVTEMSNDLGVAADYIEYDIEKLVSSGAVKQINNKYQTNFPIINYDQYNEIFNNMIDIAKNKVSDMLDKIYELKTDIQKIDMTCNDKDFDKLIVMLAMTVAEHTEGNLFDVENLPFKDIDKSWYILGAPIKQLSIKLEGGLNWSEDDNYIREYHIVIKNLIDTRNTECSKMLIQQFYKKIFDDYDKNVLAKLIEYEKVVKDGDKYRINIPIFTYNNFIALLNVLSPVIEISNNIQQDIIEVSKKHVSKFIPKRLDCEKFFTHYFAHNIINNVLVSEIKSRGIEIEQDMIAWVRLMEGHGMHGVNINKGMH